MQQTSTFTRRLAAWLMIFSAAIASSFSASATDKAEPQKYTAILIWGTDGNKPDDKDFKNVDAELTGKFKKIFKWANYYEVSREDINLKVGEPKHIVLSDKCEVKMHLTEKEGMQVELFGEKKSVYKHNHSMPLKDMLILAGDDKNATAWFVVLKPRK